jgi:hypothetical protein
VKTAESLFRSALSDEFDIFMGGMAIIKYYNQGPHSCMVFPASHWGRIENHVLMTYDAPGWGIAIISQDEAKSRASARSLVWINPDNKDDKYYIRVYGDEVLESRLVRKGFINKVPAKAPLRYVPHNGSATNILLPYFDNTGKNTGSDGGYIFCDNDRPYMLSPTTYVEMNKDATMRRHILRHHHTTLIQSITRFKGYRCSHCGEKFLSGLDLTRVGPDAEQVCKPCFDEQDYVACFVKTERGFRPRCQTIELLDGARATNDESTKRAWDIRQLDPVYYGEGCFGRDATAVLTKRGEYVWLKKDTITVISAVDGEGFVSSSRNTLDNAWVGDKGVVRLHGRTLGEVLYADKSAAPYVVTADSGKRVIPTVNTSYALSLARGFMVSKRGQYTSDLGYCTATRTWISRAYAGPYRWHTSAKMLCLSTKLQSAEAFVLAAGIAALGVDDFVESVAASGISLWPIPAPPESHGERVQPGSCQYLDVEELRKTLSMLMDREMNEIFFRPYAPKLDPSIAYDDSDRQVSDEERNAIIGMRTAWTQIRDEWARQHDAILARRKQIATVGELEIQQ